MGKKHRHRHRKDSSSSSSSSSSSDSSSDEEIRLTKAEKKKFKKWKKQQRKTRSLAVQPWQGTLARDHPPMENTGHQALSTVYPREAHPTQQYNNSPSISVQFSLVSIHSGDSMPSGGAYGFGTPGHPGGAYGFGIPMHPGGAYLPRVPMLGAGGYPPHAQDGTPQLGPFQNTTDGPCSLM